MSTPFFLLLTFSICLSVVSAQTRPVDPGTAEFKNGNSLFDKGDYEGAIGSYTKAIALKPAWAEAYLRRGYAERMSNQLDQAISDYDKATELDPATTRNNRTVAEAYTNRGQILEWNQQPEEAIIDLDKAIRLYPGDSRPFEPRGLARILIEDFAGAIADFDSYLTYEKYDVLGKALVYADRSFAKRMLGKGVEADQDLQASRKLAGKSAAAIEDRLKELSAVLTFMREVRSKKGLIGLGKKPRAGAHTDIARSSDFRPPAECGKVKRD